MNQALKEIKQEQESQREKQMEERMKKLDQERDEMIDERKQMQDKRNVMEEKRTKLEEELDEMEKELKELNKKSSLKIKMRNKVEQLQEQLDNINSNLTEQEIENIQLKIFLLNSIEEQNLQIDKQILQIDKQNLQIKEQNQLIKEQNELIKDQKKRIDKQFERVQEQNQRIALSQTNQLNLNETTKKMKMLSIEKNKKIQQIEMKDFGKSSLKQGKELLEFVDREEELETMFNILENNFNERGYQKEKRAQKFILIPGGAGLGKTRLGHEFLPFCQKKCSKETMPLQQIQKKSQQNKNQQTNERFQLMYRSIVNNSQSLYMDLSNGSKFNPEIDLKYQPEVCLGLRITCNLLNLPLDIFQYELKRKKIDPNIFRTHNVFKYIININIKKQIEKEHKKHKNIEKEEKIEIEIEKEQENPRRNSLLPLIFIFHIDEFQLYIDQMTKYLIKEMKNKNQQISEENKQDCYQESKSNFKELLKAIGHIMTHFQEICIVPICTGTSAYDISFLPTEYSRYLINLGTLKFESVKKIFQNYTQDLKEGIIKEILAKHLIDEEKIAFQIILGDLGSIPRYLNEFMKLLNNTYEIQNFEKLQFDENLLYEIEYKIFSQLNNAYFFGEFHKDEKISKRILELSLLFVPISRNDQIIKENNLKFHDLEREGTLFLIPTPSSSSSSSSKVNSDNFFVYIPFIFLHFLNQKYLIFENKYLKPINLKEDWNWQDFENFHLEFERVYNNTLKNYYKNNNNTTTTMTTTTTTSSSSSSSSTSTSTSSSSSSKSLSCLPLKTIYRGAYISKKQSLLIQLSNLKKYLHPKQCIKKLNSILIKNNFFKIINDLDQVENLKEKIKNKESCIIKSTKGNPLVDSFIIRYDNNLKPVLISCQSKHTVLSNNLPTKFLKILEWYKQTKNVSKMF